MSEYATNENPINTFSVGLEGSPPGRYVNLTFREWNSLCAYVDENESSARVAPYEHYSPRVVRVIKDWLQTRGRAPAPKFIRD